MGGSSRDEMLGSSTRTRPKVRDSGVEHIGHLGGVSEAASPRVSRASLAHEREKANNSAVFLVDVDSPEFFLFVFTM